MHTAILVSAVAKSKSSTQNDYKLMKYKIEDINIGDEVIFDSTRSQSNKDLYWTVIRKSGTRLVIELKEMGFDENWTIEINEVRGHIPLAKNN